MARKCIGVDVSKKTLDIAFYDGKIDMKNNHQKVSNDINGYEKFLTWTNKRGIEKGDMFVCLEHTGLYAYEFCCWLQTENIVYHLIPGKDMHDFSLPEKQFGLSHVKTDKTDSFRIAIYCFMYNSLLRPSKVPSESIFRLKRLVAERKQYIQQGVHYKQQLSDISKYDSESGRKRKQDLLKDIRRSISNTDKEIDDLLSHDSELHKNYNLLLSVVGIGRVNAINAIVLTGNFKIIDNPRKYASYIAIAPFPCQSGTSVKGKTMVSKCGFTQAKADLSVAAMSCLVNDPGIKSYWERKKKEGKHSGVILNAIKFKLVLRMFAVIKRQKPYVIIAQS